jgi:hypothetical protein
VHNASWKAEYHETTGSDGQIMKVPVVRVVIDGVKYTLRLRGGFERYRQLKAFQQLASGEAERGELAIYRQRSFSNFGRHDTERAPGGGAKIKTRIMLKMVAHLPVPVIKRELKGTFQVRTGKKALLVGMLPGAEKPWLYHAFQLRRAIYAYDTKRQKVAEDLKCERRPASPALRDWQERAALKMNRRIDSECRMIAAMVVGYAARNKMAEIVYNDDERRYFNRFDWGKLNLYLTMACENEGIKYTDASGTDAEEVVEEQQAAS